MIRICLVIFFNLVWLPLTSQTVETIRVKKKIKGQGKEVYQVLKSDTSIKHGNYKKFDVLHKLVVKGHYRYGVKDSLWQTYSYGKMIENTGYYRNGKKQGQWHYYKNKPNTWKPQLVKVGYYAADSMIGIWNFYKNGKIKQQYDYTYDTLLYTVPIQQWRLDYTKAIPKQLVGTYIGGWNYTVWVYLRLKDNNRYMYYLRTHTGIRVSDRGSWTFTNHQLVLNSSKKIKKTRLKKPYGETHYLFKNFVYFIKEDHLISNPNNTYAFSHETYFNLIRNTEAN